jgi:hypothetical protein
MWLHSRGAIAMADAAKGYVLAAVAGWFTCLVAGGAEMVVYRPDVVGVERLFMVALKVPRETPDIEVTVPPCVVLLDRTRLPAQSELRKFYFRSTAPAVQAEIRFAGPIEAQTVVIDIWSFAQLRAPRTLKGVDLPRRWPLGEALPELKAGQTLTDARSQEAARQAGAPATAYLELGDDAIWALQPDSTLPRWHWTNVKEGCPVHGAAIYEKGAYYPWLNDRGLALRSYTATVPYPWKIVCPVGKESYPSNDIGKDDFTSGEFPDDGMGGGFERGGIHYGFLAEIAQAYCHQMLKVAPDCARSYLVTGDARYVHKALVALSRLAVEYAYLATMTQHRHRNSQSQVERLGQAPFSEGPFLYDTGLTVYAIDQPGYQMALAEAYDRIWPAIDQDAEILPYLRGKGFALADHEQLRRFLEENLLAVWMQAALDGSTASNPPYAQWGLARMAEMLNYRRGTDFMDWLFDGAGNMRAFVANGFFRDGAPYESSGGYNGMHVTALGPIVESVEHLRALRPDVYPEARYPNLTRSRRYHNVFDFSMNTVTIDRTYPRVGDDGVPPHYGKRARITAQNGGTEAFEHAVKVFGDPKFAWALARWPDWQPAPGSALTRAQVEAAAAAWPDDWNDRSRLSDGYGLAILRSGSGEAKRALWMMYGRYRSHCHDDIMHIGLDAFQSEILGHLGYPRNWNSWYGNWMTQLVARQVPFVSMTATAQLFADAGPLQVAEALASAFTDRVAEGVGYAVDSGNGQRRCLALIDVDAERFYAVDLYSVFGGREAWWSFHGQEDDGFQVAGLNLTPQTGGTLAGADVPYGDEAWLKANGCTRSNYGYSGPMFGFAHLDHVQRASSADAWSADWTLRAAEGLHFRLSVPPGDAAQEVAVCDGRSPAGASPYAMKWLLRHDQGSAPLRSRFVSFMELYRGAPLIVALRRVELTGAGQDAAEAQAYEVILEHRRDLIFYSTAADRVFAAAGGFEFAGRFGLYSETRDGQPLRAALVGGTRLTRNGVGITQASAGGRARIVAVDRVAGTVTVEQPVSVARAWVGRVVHVVNPVRRVSLQVLAVSGDEQTATLQVEYDPCIGVGRSRGAADERVLTDTTFYLRGCRYYHGARLVAADGTTEYPVKGVHSGAFVLVGAEGTPPVPGAELERAFPAGSWFSIYDYGVGDGLEWTNSVSREF